MAPKEPCNPTMGMYGSFQEDEQAGQLADAPLGARRRNVTVGAALFLTACLGVAMFGAGQLMAPAEAPASVANAAARSHGAAHSGHHAAQHSGRHRHTAKRRASEAADDAMSWVTTVGRCRLLESTDGSADSPLYDLQMGIEAEGLALCVQDACGPCAKACAASGACSAYATDANWPEGRCVFYTNGPYHGALPGYSTGRCHIKAGSAAKDALNNAVEPAAATTTTVAPTTTTTTTTTTPAPETVAPVDPAARLVAPAVVLAAAPWAALLPSNLDPTPGTAATRPESLQADAARMEANAVAAEDMPPPPVAVARP